MDIKNLLSHFPKKSFSEVFEERKNELLSRNVDEKIIQNKKNEYKKIFHFDKVVTGLREVIESDNSIKISEFEAERILFFTSKIQELNIWLKNLDFSNTQDINTVFKNFQDNIHNNKYFHQLSYSANGENLHSGKVVIDEYTRELSEIKYSLEIRSLEIGSIKKGKEVADQILKNGPKYLEAIKKANNWIEVEEKTIEIALQKPAIAFDEKAQEHKNWKTWFWFIGAILFGIIVMGIVVAFIVSLWEETDISVGTALLRISALIVPSYFTLYCSQQFTNHRKLYEIYMFKYIALETMTDLYKRYTDPVEQQKILDKAITIIFTEPRLKEDSNYKQIAVEFKDILKSRLINE